MNIEELFKIDASFENPPKMTSGEFVEKTRAILIAMDNYYSQAVSRRRLNDNEYKQNDCDNCKGNCTIKVGDKVLDCRPNHEDGDCFVDDFDSEAFVDEIENIMFHDEKFPFYELLQAEIIDNKLSEE